MGPGGSGLDIRTSKGKEFGLETWGDFKHDKPCDLSSPPKAWGLPSIKQLWLSQPFPSAEIQRRGRNLQRHAASSNMSHRMPKDRFAPGVHKRPEPPMLLLPVTSLLCQSEGRGEITELLSPSHAQWTGLAPLRVSVSTISW